MLCDEGQWCVNWLLTVPDGQWCVSWLVWVTAWFLTTFHTFIWLLHVDDSRSLCFAGQWYVNRLVDISTRFDFYPHYHVYQRSVWCNMVTNSFWCFLSITCNFARYHSMFHLVNWNSATGKAFSRLNSSLTQNTFLNSHAGLWKARQKRCEERITIRWTKFFSVKLTCKIAFPNQKRGR